MIKEAYIAGEQAALEKVGSTAYSRMLAKSLGGTPKSVTKPLYEEAMRRSGKTGVDALGLLNPIQAKIAEASPSPSYPIQIP